MYGQKTGKRNLPDKNDYTYYNPHSINNETEINNIRNERWDKGYYQYLSIDPGFKNLAVRIEKRYINKDDSGQLIAFPIDTILFEKVEILSESLKGNGKANWITNVHNFLRERESLFLECHYCIIERQLAINYKMVRLSTTILSYICNLLRDNYLLSVIIEIDPSIKSKRLAPGMRFNKKEVKNWAIEKALELCEIRKDEYSITTINEAPKSKRDDLSDTLIQIEAFCVLFNLPLTGSFSISNSIDI